MKCVTTSNRNSNSSPSPARSRLGTKTGWVQQTYNYIGGTDESGKRLERDEKLHTIATHRHRWMMLLIQ